MKHTRVNRSKYSKRSKRRFRLRTWLPLIAVVCVVCGAALIAHAISLLSNVPVSQNPPTSEGEESVIGTTTYGTSFEATTASTTTTTATTTTAPTTSTAKNTSKYTTTKPQTVQTSPPISTEGHFVQDRNNTPWNLVLANPWNPLPNGFDNNLDLKGNLKGYSHEKVDVRAYESLKKMLADGAKYDLSICSGYRSVAKQTDLFEGRVKKWMDKGYTRAQAEKEVLKDTARPGTSEHNTGLAADLLGGSYTWLSESFADTEAYEWLISHCAEYGFILRYPKGKESITGYTFEPWHYRYVGVEAATYIMEHKLTLEEYLEQIS